MTDREERQHVIEVLEQMRLDYKEFWDENNNEVIRALNYAIASIETDLKYDLLYEETSGQKEPSNSEIPTGSIIDWNNCHTSEQLDSIATTKKDLAVDCRSLEDIKKLVERKADALDGVMLDAGGVIIGLYFAIANDLPPATPQEPQSFKWCTDCKEYDQEKHCCHRYSKVIRDTVAEIGQEPKTGHCKDCKWWKDSDGAYRRGCNAESKCPISHIEVYEGNGYCFLYEPQKVRDKE